MNLGCGIYQAAAGKVGYSSIPLYEAMIRTMIKHDGGDSQNVDMIEVGFVFIPAISTKKVDAIIGGFYQSRAINAG